MLIEANSLIQPLTGRFWIGALAGRFSLFVY